MNPSLGIHYASQAFVALAAEEKVSGFRGEYVGRINLPKKHGEFSVYRLDRWAGSARSR